MKMRSLFALALLAVPASLAAQGGGPPQGRGGQGMRGAQNSAQLLLDNAADLALTADQTAKVKTLADSLTKLNAPQQAVLTKMREAGNMADMSDADRTKMREASTAMRTNDQTIREALQKVLSADQWTKAEAIFAAAMPQRRRGGGGG
jgi:Spy/CpxP family protein refolding chaperone